MNLLIDRLFQTIICLKNRILTETKSLTYSINHD